MKHPRIFPWIWVSALVLVVIVVLSPLLRPGFYITDDGEWMVIRLSAFYQSLAEGQFPVRFLGRLNNSYGYPVSNFLYPGFLYIGSLIHVVGPTFVDTVKILLAGSVLISSFFLYLFLSHWFGISASVVGVISFVGSPYLLYDLYRRGSVGEVLAFAPASMMVYAIASQSYWLLPLATALLIVSHNTLALILSVACVAFMVNRKDTTTLLRQFAIGVGLSAFFWIPALLERRFTVFDSIIVSDPSQYFVGANNALLLGIPTLIAVGYTMWSHAHGERGTRVICMIILVGYFFSLPISGLLWELPMLVKFVQFPYRFLSLVVLFGPWVVAYTYTHLRHVSRVVVFSIAGLFYIYAAWSLVGPIEYVDRPEGYYTTNEGSTTVGDEYMPRWVSQRPLHRSAQIFEFISGDAQAQIKSITTQTIDISIRASAPSVLQINKLYYPGWGVAIDDVLVPIDYSDPAGLMRVRVPTGEHHIVANFRETIPRFLADVVSVMFGVFYLLSFWRKKIRV